MALITANGKEVLETRSTRRRTGAWRFDLLVDDPDALVGPVTIDVNSGALTFKGTAVRSGVFSDTGHVRVIAGAGGLSTLATPRHYSGTSVGGVLADLLADAGETLSTSADANVLGQPLAAWTTAAAPIATLISLLLAAGAPGAVWRSLPDGTIWVGFETWPDAGIDDATYQIFEDAAETNSMLVGCDAPFLLPGTTFEGRRVSYIEDVVGQEGAGVTTRILFEDATSITDVDRVRKSFFRLARRAAAATDRIDYSRRYPAQIISQTSKTPTGEPALNTIDVLPDQVNGKDLIGDMGGVPLLTGLPGVRLDGVHGGRCMVGWLGGDPSKPYASEFDTDALLSATETAAAGTLVIADGTAGVARQGDSTKLTMSPQDIVSLATALLATGAFMTSGSPPSAPPTPLPFTDGEITGSSSIVKIG
jgi:hypothetical protein